MRCGEPVYLRRELHTPIGWYSRGLAVLVLADRGDSLIVCTDGEYHPTSFCHTVIVPTRHVSKEAIPVARVRNHSRRAMATTTERQPYARQHDHFR